MPASQLRVQLFGSLSLLRDGENDLVASGSALLPSSAVARSLLAYLLLKRKIVHSRPVLVGIFWPDQPESRARRALTQALWQIRRVLPELIQADASTVRVAPQYSIWVDVEEFLGLLGNEQVVAADLRRAIELYRGKLLEGIHDEWVLVERERLRESYLRALQQLVELAKSAGRYQEAQNAAVRLTQAEPLQESAPREVMQLYFVLGRPEAALHQFESYRQYLQAELSFEPDPDMLALANEIASRSGLDPIDT